MFMSADHVNTRLWLTRSHNMWLMKVSQLLTWREKKNYFNVKAASAFNVPFSLDLYFQIRGSSCYVETHNAWRAQIHFKVRNWMTSCYIIFSENSTVSNRILKKLFNNNFKLVDNTSITKTDSFIPTTER